MKFTKLSGLPKVKASHCDFYKQVMIENEEVPNIFTFAQVTLEPGQVAPNHGHDGMYEIFLIEEGAAQIITNGKQKIVAQKGTCVITEPDETHEVKNPYNEKVVITYFQSKV